MSPDGRWIAYASDARGEYELYVRPADGSGEPRRLTEGDRTYFGTPQWAPDSQRVCVTDHAGRLLLIGLDVEDS